MTDPATSHDESDVLLDMVRDFGRRRLRPAAASSDSQGAVPVPVMAELHSMGLFPAVAEEYGGQGTIDPALHLAVIRELAYFDPAVAFVAGAGVQAAARVIQMAGTEVQRRQWLPAFASDGARRGAIAYYEGYGRSPLELETVAAPVSTGWCIDGTKRAVVGAGSAQEWVVVARLGVGGLAAFVARRPDGAMAEVSPDAGDTAKMGLRGADTSTVSIRAWDVGRAALLGEPDALELHRAVAWMRLVPAVVALGIGRAALDYAVDYAQERQAFGRNIIDYQGVEFPLTEADMALDAAELAVLATWDEVSESADRVRMAGDTGRAVRVATAAAVDTTRTAVNTLGGHGYLVDHPVERWYRDASTLSALDFDPLRTSVRLPDLFAADVVGL